MPPSALVIGAGIIGCAVADALASRGARVIVLDRRYPGAGASHASAGILAPYVEAQTDTPLLGLCARSLGMYDDFIARVSQRSGQRIEYSRTGTLAVALSEDEVDSLRTSSELLTGHGVDARWLEAEDLRAFEPALTSTAFGGLLVPAHGFVGVPSLMSALVQSARLSGAWFESPVEVTHVEANGDHVEVRTAAKTYSADVTVIASGSWSGKIRIAGESPLSVRPVRGQLLRLHWRGSEPPRRVVWGPRCYTVPWSDGSLLVGATVEEVGFDESTTLAGVRDLMDAAGELLPHAWHASLEEVRVGLRPASEDGLPIISPLDSAPNVIVATGHYRNGVLLAPLTAEIVANHVM